MSILLNFSSIDHSHFFLESKLMLLTSHFKKTKKKKTTVENYKLCPFASGACTGGPHLCHS